MISIAIPSYQRARVLREKTLALLLNGGVPPDRITVFVASETEKEDYAAALSGSAVRISVGVLGIAPQRRHITLAYPEGERLVCLDDDVSALLRLGPDERLAPVQDVWGLFQDCFAETERRGLKVWGIYPVSNAMFMAGRPAITDSLSFCIGLCFGVINRHCAALRTSPELREKEDVEFSILAHRLDGGIVRFNHIAARTNFKGSGGLGRAEGRLDANRAAAEYLCRVYPDVCSLRVRKNGMAEVRLKAAGRRKIASTPPSPFPVEQTDAPYHL